MPKSRRTSSKPSTRAAKVPAATRKSAPPAPPLYSCNDCGKCCTYVAIEIESPTSVKHATMMLWYLYHENMSVYLEAEGDWLLQVESRCRHLGKDKRCGIYEVRPHICRDFDEQHCEVNTGDDGQTFRTPAELLEYLRVKRPKVHAKLAAGYARVDDLVPAPPSRRKLPIAPAVWS